MSQSTVLKAVLFDLDGTLIDSAPDLGAAADKLRTDRGMPSLDLSLYRPHAGAGARGLRQIIPSSLRCARHFLSTTKAP